MTPTPEDNIQISDRPLRLHKPVAAAPFGLSGLLKYQYLHFIYTCGRAAFTSSPMSRVEPPGACPRVKSCSSIDMMTIPSSSPTSPTSPTSPLAPYPPIPPTEHRSRAPEFYGFVAWTSTSVAFVLYVLWALLPDEYIIWLGVEWYPSR